MGYFTDIIRDSYRGSAALRLVDCDPGGNRMPVPSTERGIEENSMKVPIGMGIEDQSVKKIWEEGDKRPAGARQDLASVDTGSRQVVDPLPLEHTPVTGLPGAQVGQAVVPVPEQQKQAGYASNPMAADEHGRVQRHSLHGDGSLHAPGKPAGVQFASVPKVVSGDAVTPAGNVPAATQGRRQAGSARAGETTPPEYTLERQGVRPSRHQQDLASGDDGQSIGSNNGPRGTASLVAKPDFSAGQPSRTAVEPDGKTVKSLPDTGSHTGKMTQPSCRPADPDVASPYPWPMNHQSGRSKAHSYDREKAAHARESLPAAPQVRIGTIEVVVMMPVPESPVSAGRERLRPDLSSRHYLRNC